jgi:hypothetical protein
VVALLGLIIAAILTPRLPQAALTWIFPNDYVYRFTVSVTIGGKTYTGETVNGCRVQRSPLSDAFENASGNRWHSRMWATPLTVALPQNRFLFISALNVASCHHERPGTSGPSLEALAWSDR